MQIVTYDFINIILVKQWTNIDLYIKLRHRVILVTQS